jgi:hypothetical protein
MLILQKLMDSDGEPIASWNSVNPEKNRLFKFSCGCRQALKIDMESYIGRSLDFERAWSKQDAEHVRSHFGLRSDNSLVDGWPRLRIEVCPSCSTQYLVYVNVIEPANGLYYLSLNAIARIEAGP